MGKRVLDHLSNDEIVLIMAMFNGRQEHRTDPLFRLVERKALTILRTTTPQTFAQLRRIARAHQ